MVALLIAAMWVIAACGSASSPGNATPEAATPPPVTFTFVQPEQLDPPIVTPQPGMAIDYEKLVIAHPGQKTKEYDGVTIMFHQAAPQNKMLLINKEGLKRLLDFLNQKSKTRLVFILAPDDREMNALYDPVDEMLVVQVHASVPPAQLTGSLIAAILKRGDMNLDTQVGTAKAYALYAAMRCVSTEGYQGMILPEGTLHVSEADYAQMLPVLCGIESLLVYTDAISVPTATPQPVVPNSDNTAA